MHAGPMSIALIQEFEQGPKGGFAAHPYRCPSGHMTVGWGHRLLFRDTWTFPLDERTARDLLEADLARMADIINNIVSAPLTQSMFDALCAFVFNVGGSAFVKSTLYRKLNAGDYVGAADEFLRWDKATDPKTGRKKPLTGLIRRRQAECALFLRNGIPKRDES